MSEKMKFIIAAVMMVLSAVLYLVLPIDILPDFLDGIGRVDDIVVLCIQASFALVFILSGFNYRVKLSKVRSEQMQWNEDFRQTYGEAWGY